MTHGDAKENLITQLKSAPKRKGEKNSENLKILKIRLTQ